MTCARVRRLLAAYRRDDWSPDDLATLTEHLTACAECRQMEAAYREVGQHVRQLPSITPPPDFRASVFAAIRAEERRVAPEVARLARAATNPELPVVRPGVRLVRPAPVRRAAFTPRSGLAAAAILVVGVLTASILPHIAGASFASTAASLNSAPAAKLSLARPRVTGFTLQGSYAFAGSAAASASWLVYTAVDPTAGAMLFAENRQSKRVVPLLGSSTQTPLAVRAVTDSWSIWTSGAGTSDAPWTLNASRLPSSGASTTAAPITLVSSTAPGADNPVTLGGVWAHGNTVLIAAATASGSGVLLRIDLSSGAPVTYVVARSTQSGHLLADPSSDGASYYWSDVWLDAANDLHGTVWRGDDAGHDEEISTDDAAFHPAATAGTLVWVEVPRDTLATAASAAPAAATRTDADADILTTLHGALEARNLATGSQWQVSPSADVSGISTGGSLVLWRSDSQTHVYNLSTRTAGAVDAQVRAAAFASIGQSAVVWAQTGSSTLYVADTK